MVVLRGRQARPCPVPYALVGCLGHQHVEKNILFPITSFFICSFLSTETSISVNYKEKHKKMTQKIRCRSNSIPVYSPIVAVAKHFVCIFKNEVKTKRKEKGEREMECIYLHPSICLAFLLYPHGSSSITFLVFILVT